MVSEIAGMRTVGRLSGAAPGRSRSARRAARRSRLSVLSLAVRAGIGGWRDSRAVHSQIRVLPDELVDAVESGNPAPAASEFEGSESQGTAVSVPHAGFGHGTDHADVAGQHA